MSHKKTIYMMLFGLFSSYLYGQTESSIHWNTLPVSNSTKEYILKNKIFVSANMDTKKIIKTSKKEQILDYKIAGLHPKTCKFALRKLSQYESFKDFIGFIKDSQYDEKEKRILLHMSHPLLPFNMTLKFVIPRIKKPGHYKFTFDRGFLKGLKGNIYVSQYKNRCLFYSTAFWRGPESKIPDMVFELFSNTLGKLAMEKLFKISATY